MRFIIPIILLGLSLAACRPSCANSVQGWDYNDPKNGGFQKVPFEEQETAPEMILVSGKSFNHDSTLVEVSSFYCSKYEETNGQYLSYLNSLQKLYSRATYEAALPDTMIWYTIGIPERDARLLSALYLRDVEYSTYPVVGLNRKQIERYAQWKTDRMNEYILIREGVILKTEPEDSSEVFTTQGYLNGDDLQEERFIADLDPDSGEKIVRRVRLEDGILMPSYRLLTSEEWKFAAYAIGDEHYNYCKTPKPGKVRLEQLPERFHCLAPNEYTTQASSFDLFLNVRNQELNNYSIHGLSGGLAELVADSTATQVAGCNYTADHYYATTYCDPNHNGHVDYLFEGDKVPVVSTSAFMGLYTFRFAMKRYGSPICKRRKKGRKELACEK